MSFSAQKATPFEVSNEALNKIVNLKTNEGAKCFRFYVTGGGCSGFQYGFKFDEYDEDEDTKLDFDQNVTILLDELSYPYILGSKVDYVENLMGAKFVIDNPNAKTTCGCGASFSI